MILVLDIDGTLADLNHREFLVADKARADWDAFFSDEYIYKDVPIRNAIAGHNLFVDLADKVYVLTGRPESAQAKTIEWLVEQGFDMSKALDNMLFRPDDLVLSSREFKRAVLESIIMPENNPSEKYVFIDDDIKNLDMFSEYGLALKAPDVWRDIVGVR